MVIHSSQEKKSVLQTLLKSSEYSQSVGLPSNDIPYVATNADRKLQYLL